MSSPCLGVNVWQDGRQHLRFSEARADAVGAEVADSATKDADLMALDLARVARRSEPDRPLDDVACPKATSLSQPVVPAQVFSTPGTRLENAKQIKSLEIV